MQLIINSKNNLFLLGKISFICLIFFFGFFTNLYMNSENGYSELLNPFVDSGKIISKPLQSYSILNLQNREYQSSKIILENIISEEETYTSFQFAYTTLGKRMTGQINIPDNITANPEQKRNVIIMIRGFVPSEIYSTGVGTKNAAAVFANDGYITIAPDFFGYGDSDPEPKDTWQTRFEKPITVIELIKSLEENGIPLNLESQRTNTKLDLDVTKVSNIGIWAHSNGGQIALATLEILQKPIPTSLWAPVTAPFPYSILYFSDELEDEGKEQRRWISLFEENYDVFDFSITKHLESLTGPIQIQHGDNDDAALIFWSQEFVAKIDLENQNREMLMDKEKSASASAIEHVSPLPPVEIDLITYPNTNHNMVPSWDKAVKKDLQFFDNWMK